jgi:hypothetical protein
MGSVDREVRAGEQPADSRQVQHTRKELGCDIAVEQPNPVLAEYRRIPHRILRREPDEPAEQQIVVELLPLNDFISNAKSGRFGIHDRKAQA